MTVTDKISTCVKSMRPGIVFTMADLQITNDAYPAAAKAISRMVQKGELKKLSIGKYYKPEYTQFGEIGPSEDQQLKAFLFKDGKRIAYITGPSLLNRLHFTTQLSRTIWIASRDKRIIARVGNLQVKSVKCYADVNDENFKLLEILDVIKDFRRIPDSSIEQFLISLTGLLEKLTKKERRDLATLSLNYPPRVRAVLGAILENIVSEKVITEKLSKSLNPLSVYKLNIPQTELPNARNWYIQ